VCEGAAVFAEYLYPPKPLGVRQLLVWANGQAFSLRCGLVQSKILGHGVFSRPLSRTTDFTLFKLKAARSSTSDIIVHGAMWLCGLRGVMGWGCDRWSG